MIDGSSMDIIDADLNAAAKAQYELKPLTHGPYVIQWEDLPPWLQGHLRGAQLTRLHREQHKLRRALELAVALLGQHEPGDSRAVSDEFVALATVVAQNDDAKSWNVIEAALARYPASCPVCGGDCAGANPPVMHCPAQPKPVPTGACT
jgi:hypothetical protein